MPRRLRGYLRHVILDPSDVVSWDHEATMLERLVVGRVLDPVRAQRGERAGAAFRDAAGSWRAVGWGSPRRVLAAEFADGVVQRAGLLEIAHMAGAGEQDELRVGDPACTETACFSRRPAGRVGVGPVLGRNARGAVDHRRRPE
jgi:hypothetical protein